MSKINKNVCALCAIAAIALPVNGETPKVRINHTQMSQTAQVTDKVTAVRNRSSEVIWVVPAISALIILTLGIDFFKKEVKKSTGADKIIQKIMEQKREHDC